MPTALIVGGSSGLGLELAKLLRQTYDPVIITGRTDPKVKSIYFHHLELGAWESWGDLWNEIYQNADVFPRMQFGVTVDLFVYAAGFCQEGTLGDLSCKSLYQMANVGLLAPAFMLQLFMRHQKTLPGFIAVTSTSQWNPREIEPMYAACKAGLGMLANSFALDPGVGKVLVAGPSGIKSPFWRNSPRDTTGMLDPKWVAKRILEAYEGDFKYKFVKILRNPDHVEIAEERK